MILHGLTSVFLCVPFIFADNEKYQFGGAHDDFLCITESLVVLIFHRSYFNNRGAFKKFLIYTAVYNGLNLADNET